MKKNLRIIIYSLILGILVFFGVSLAGSLDKKTVDVSPTPIVEVENQARLVIYYDDEITDSYSYAFTEEKSAFDMLKEIAQQENISIETQQYDFGVFVKSIDGFEGTSEMAWMYYVNDESGTVAADQYKLKGDDLVEWKYIELDVGE